MDITTQNPPTQPASFRARLDAGLADTNREAEAFSRPGGDTENDAQYKAYNIRTQGAVYADGSDWKADSRAGSLVDENNRRLVFVRGFTKSVRFKISGVWVKEKRDFAPLFRQYSALDRGSKRGKNAKAGIHIPRYHHKPFHDDLAAMWVRHYLGRGYTATGGREPVYARYGDVHAPKGERSALRADGLVTRNGGAVRHYVEVDNTHTFEQRKFEVLSANSNPDVHVWIFDVGPPSVKVQLLRLYDVWLLRRFLNDVDGVKTAENTLMAFAQRLCVRQLPKGVKS